MFHCAHCKFNFVDMTVTKLIKIEIIVVQTVLIFMTSYGYGSAESWSDMKIAMAGTTAKIEEVPWTVLILTDDNTGGSRLCTGAIISPKWVLSAAHCVAGVEANKVTMIAGVDDLTNKTYRGKGQTKTAIRMQIHPYYSSNGAIGQYDVALLKVDQPWNYSTKVQPLKLHGLPWSKEEERGRNCLASGWGEITAGVASYQLRKVNVTAVHGERRCPCMGSWGSIRLMPPFTRLVCLKEYGKGICPGDSGSALVCGNEGVGVAHVMYSALACTILSWMDQKMECNKPYIVSAYIYTCPVLNWIHQYVPIVPRRPKSCSAKEIKSPVILPLMASWIVTIHF